MVPHPTNRYGTGPVTKYMPRPKKLARHIKVLLLILLNDQCLIKSFIIMSSHVNATKLDTLLLMVGLN
jgi:hypothetical protein